MNIHNLCGLDSLRNIFLAHGTNLQIYILQLNAIQNRLHQGKTEYRSSIRCISRLILDWSLYLIIAKRAFHFLWIGSHFSVRATQYRSYWISGCYIVWNFSIRYFFFLLTATWNYWVVAYRLKNGTWSS